MLFSLDASHSSVYEKIGPASNCLIEMILPKMFPKPTIKSLSGKRRNWAKSHKLYLTADNRINAKLIIREMKFLDFEICQTIPLGCKR